MEKIDVKDIKIERLNEKHNISDFQSYEKELVDFLVEDALDNQKNRISVTYLIFLESGELVGYVTLLNDRINLEGDLKDIFRGKGIAYHSLPALKIGRLCVDHRFLRMGIGTLIIFLINLTASSPLNVGVALIGFAIFLQKFIIRTMLTCPELNPEPSSFG